MREVFLQQRRLPREDGGDVGYFHACGQLRKLG